MGTTWGLQPERLTNRKVPAINNHFFIFLLFKGTEAKRVPAHPAQFAKIEIKLSGICLICKNIQHVH
jgi:hypothetical protein